MNDNFENEMNSVDGNSQSEEQKPAGNEASAQPVENVGNTEYKSAQSTDRQNFANPIYGEYSNSNQYMPYGSFNSYGPEAPKKATKGKKAGIVIAVMILLGILVISVGVVIGVIFGKVRGGETNQSKDDTQIDFALTPETDDGTDAGGVLSAKEVYKKVHESSVGILVYSGNKQRISSEGTGVVLSTNSDKTGTYIITCAHVIDVQNPKILVQTTDGTQYDAVVVGSDSKTDIGLLLVSTTDLTPAEFADSEKLEVGETVYAIGNPGGTQFFGSFTNGMISAIGRPVDSPVGYEVACIQHTAAINPGNSGGALVNAHGQVIGINSSKIASTDFEGMGFAVPSATVKEIVDQLIKDGKVTNRPALGIKFMPATNSQTYSIIVKTNDLPAGSIIIDTIMDGSDLANVDVEEGDMIIAVDGEDLNDYDIVMEKIENCKVGDTLKLTICRVDSNYKITTFDVSVKLVEDSTLSEPVKEETQTLPFQFPFGN